MSGILDQFRLDKQIAIVTGASKGLGAAMAISLAEAGADVALVARSSCADAKAQIEALGRRAVDISADLQDRASMDTVIPKVIESLGQPTILVNNGGTIRRNDFTEYSDEDWDAVMEININALFRLSRAFSKSLVEAGKKGKIVNVASMLSYQGGIRVAAYTASKSAVMGLTRLMANELAPKGINTNAIAPGYFATDNTQALREDSERNAAILDRIPAGRWGDPKDLGGAVVYLSSPASDYMHGYTMAVDGGWLAR